MKTDYEMYLEAAAEKRRLEAEKDIMRNELVRLRRLEETVLGPAGETGLQQENARLRKGRDEAIRQLLLLAEALDVEIPEALRNALKETNGESK